MEKLALVVVIGGSLLADGIESCLLGKQSLRVVPLDPARAGLDRRAKALQPDVVVFELNTLPPAALLSLIKENPGTLFLAIDLNCSEVIVLNSSRRPIGNLREFCQLAQTGLDAGARLRACLESPGETG